MKILIIEIIDHAHEIGGKYAILSKLGHCDVLISKHLVELVENVPKSNIIAVNIRHRSLHLNILKLARIIRRYDYAFLNTSPEYWNHKIGGMLINTSFFLLTLIARSRIIPHVRNLDAYQKQEHSRAYANLNRAILRQGLRSIKRITSDSETTRTAARSVDFLRDKLLGVLYFSFYDHEARGKGAATGVPKDKVVVGLLGRVETKRRDYRMIFDMLNQLDAAELQKLEFQVMGACPDEEAVEIVGNLSKIVAVAWNNSRYMPQEMFDQMGDKCDLFFAPLSPKQGYGTSKETGAFGDAINYGKKVIIPRNACQTGEFDSVCIFYDDEEDLLSIFKNILSNPDKLGFAISEDYLREKSPMMLSKNVRMDLELG